MFSGLIKQESPLVSRRIGTVVVVLFNRQLGSIEKPEHPRHMFCMETLMYYAGPILSTWFTEQRTEWLNKDFSCVANRKCFSHLLAIILSGGSIWLRVDAIRAVGIILGGAVRALGIKGHEASFEQDSYSRFPLKIPVAFLKSTGTLFSMRAWYW